MTPIAFFVRSTAVNLREVVSATLITSETTTIQIPDHIEYPGSGVLNKLIWKDEQCQYSLFCLAAGTEISEHTSARNATVQVLEGTGSLTLDGATIPLVPGTFVFMVANAPHAVTATENLAFLLSLSSPH